MFRVFCDDRSAGGCELGVSAVNWLRFLQTPVAFAKPPGLSEPSFFIFLLVTMEMNVL